MDVKAEVCMRNMPEDTDLEVVQNVMRTSACEWLDMDRHPQDLTVTVADSPTAKILTTGTPSWIRESVRRTGPYYAISDLHLGDGGPRDNFAFGTHEKELLAFLDMVDDVRGRLVICGDLFELWQSNMSKVLTKRVSLLDRLARMGAIYVLGNHDADLNYFVGMHNRWLNHPFFDSMTNAFNAKIGERWFHFTHGHLADQYCASDTPGIGRITAIYSGLAEDKNGGPMLDKYRTVEDKVVGRLEKLVSLWNRLRGKPDRFTEINRHLRDWYECDNSALVCGHTHFPGRIGDWLYNCGTWAERVNSFVCINRNGTAGVFDWKDYRAVPNQTELPI